MSVNLFSGLADERRDHWELSLLVTVVLEVMAAAAAAASKGGRPGDVVQKRPVRRCRQGDGEEKRVIRMV